MYYIYTILCEKEKLYTGITTDYKRRFLEHAEKSYSRKGAKFTKAFKPEKIVMLYKTDTRSDALRLESRIKNLKKEDKIALINDRKMFKKFFEDYIDIRLYKRILVPKAI